MVEPNDFITALHLTPCKTHLEHFFWLNETGLYLQINSRDNAIEEIMIKQQRDCFRDNKQVATNWMGSVSYYDGYDVHCMHKSDLENKSLDDIIAELVNVLKEKTDVTHLGKLKVD